MAMTREQARDAAIHRVFNMTLWQIEQECRPRSITVVSNRSRMEHALVDAITGELVAAGGMQ